MQRNVLFWETSQQTQQMGAGNTLQLPSAPKWFFFTKSFKRNQIPYSVSIEGVTIAWSLTTMHPPHLPTRWEEQNLLGTSQPPGSHGQRGNDSYARLLHQQQWSWWVRSLIGGHSCFHHEDKDDPMWSYGSFLLLSRAKREDHRIFRSSIHEDQK